MTPDLAQATCAVVPHRSAGLESSLGTAWLVTDQGHLLTAGHVVRDGYRADGTGRVWLLFTDTEQAVPATYVFPPEVDIATGLDFALLQLEQSAARVPLPFTLVSRAEGAVTLHGYDAALPRAQSVGTGTLLGNVLRNAFTQHYLFRYAGPTVARAGFSGAAVYSEDVGAVIGIQTEAEPDRATAFALPLARIAEHWSELVSTAVTPRRGTCVLLLPDGHSEADRHRIVEVVVRPTLEAENLSVYVSEVGHVGAEDLRQLERADVVVADVTHLDPGVVHELTVAQGLGTPDVVFAESGHDHSRASALFDVLEMDMADPASARRLLAGRLVTVRSIYDALGESASVNPVTSFFRAPLTQISVAPALALGYHMNFVQPMARALLDLREFPERGSVLVDGQEVAAEVIAGSTLTVVLPERLDWTRESFQRRHLRGNGSLVEARIEHPSFARARSLTARPLDDGPLRLLDPFPTTLATIAASIDDRLTAPGVSDPRALTAWAEIERKEIDRFYSRLVQRIARDPWRSNEDFRIGDVARVVSWRTEFPELVAVL